MSTIIKGDIQTMRNNLIREKEEKKKEKEKKSAALHNARTDSTLYATKQWKKLRNWYIMQHPCCEIHLRYGVVKPAKEIHHMKPILTGETLEEQRKLCYDVSNLLSVCHNCHTQVHAEQNWRDGKLDDCIPYELVEY